MTDREALHLFEKIVNDEFGSVTTERLKQASVCAIHALEKDIKSRATREWMSIPEASGTYSAGHFQTSTCKVENSPTQEFLDLNRVDVPSNAKPSEIADLRGEIGAIEDNLDELYGRVKRLEAVVFYGGKE